MKKAINVFIFGGSATLGVEAAGYKVEKVLELVDGMENFNSYHWVKNRPDVPIIDPSVWENDEYLTELAKSDVDFSFCNTNCSGLSLANRNASVDAEVNKNFYRASYAFSKFKPKAFVIENAPTLISFGTPILQRVVDDLKDDYKFTVIRDEAGNHNVPMKRARTMVVGWRTDVFDNKIPQVYMRKNENGEYTLRNAFEGISHNHPNQLDYPDDKKDQFLIEGAVKNGHSVDMEAALNLDKYAEQLKAISEIKYNGIVRLSERMKVKAIWDKSPGATDWDKKCGSMTSYTRHIHPDGQRYMTVREYAALMGYPHDFVFHPGGKTPYVQCIAQGVPVNFVKWIGEEVSRSLDNPKYLSKNDVVFQNNLTEKYDEFSFEDFARLTKVETTNKAKKLSDEDHTISIDSFL